MIKPEMCFIDGLHTSLNQQTIEIFDFCIMCSSIYIAFGSGVHVEVDSVNVMKSVKSVCNILLISR